MDLYTMMKDYAGSDDPTRMLLNNDEYLNIFPTKNVKVPVDINLVRKNGTVTADDSVVSELDFTIPKNAIGKNESAILNIIAANNWERPIYFTSLYDELGFGKYLRVDGMTYRLVPVENDPVNEKWSYDVMMNKFGFGNANIPGVYFDEENRRHLNSIRLQFAQVALSLIDKNKKDEANNLLERSDKNMLVQNFPYAMPSRGQRQNQFSTQFLVAAYKAGNLPLAKKISDELRKDLEQQVTYFNNLDDNKQISLYNDNQMVVQLLQQIQGMEQVFKNGIPPMQEQGSGVIKNAPIDSLKDSAVHDRPQ
jgi:hypothetical protein